MIGQGRVDDESELCGGYSIWRGSANFVEIINYEKQHTTPKIPSKVVEVGHDKRFIIAKQNEKWYKPNPDDPRRVLDYDVFHYWILDTSVPIAHGPLTLDEYVEKRKELGVPEGIKLMNVYEHTKKRHSKECL